MGSNLITFLNNFGGIQDIENTFIEFRQILRGAGFKQEDLANVSSAPIEAFQKFDTLRNKINQTKKELEDYGILNTESDFKNFDSYISRKLSKIEERTPLNGDDEIWESKAKK